VTIHDQHHDISRDQRFLTARDPELFHGIVRDTNPSRIHQRDRHPIQHDFTLQQIARGAWQFGHDRPLPTAEAIQQRTFPNVGATHQCHPQAMPEGIASLPIRHQGQQLSSDRLQFDQQGRSIERRQIVLEINPCLELL
jgi:hypothetical protein